jgi:hypothetical protein
MITSTIVTEDGETVITIKCGSYYRVERTETSFTIREEKPIEPHIVIDKRVGNIPDRKEVESLREDGMSYDNIARKLGVNIKTLQGYRRVWETEDASKLPDVRIITDEKNRRDIEECLTKSREEDARKARVVEARKTVMSLGKK